MAEFSELIKNFDKIRDYMRDFYIYGFKSRTEFTKKSSRTYDNEKRRIESYMGDYMQWDYTKKGKQSFIAMNTSYIPMNPLYSAWKSKSFTSNDIMLHFYILDTLMDHEELSIEAITDEVCLKSEQDLDVQIVRNKCNKYVKSGLLNSVKKGKTLYYSLSDITIEDLSVQYKGLIHAIKFFQGSTLFGEVGSYILDCANVSNDLFLFKHNYIAHTLEDGILLELLSAIRNHQMIEFTNFSERSRQTSIFKGVPLKVFVSTTTGRRYICIYRLPARRFFNYRLDYIKSVKSIGLFSETEELHDRLNRNLDKVFGVGFDGRFRLEIICMKVYIDEEQESYILERLFREGRGGEILKLETNIFLYTRELFDTNDISPWIKTFTGRIIQLEGTNEIVINRFYTDIKKMKQLYESE